MYGDVAVALLRELKRAAWLPIYNDDAMRKIIREIEALYKIIFQTLHVQNYQVEDPSIACGLVVHHTSLLRNKRCALAYLSNRLAKATEIWWQAGSVVPEEVKGCLSNNEHEFYEGYDKLMNQYMSKAGVDLTADQAPPKDTWIEVRVLKNHDKILTQEGDMVLTKNEQIFLRRSDAEVLIRQGVVKLMNNSEDLAK